MSTKKIIAFLDVLGFKDLVENNTHEDLAVLYERLFSSMINLGLASDKRQFFEKDGKQYWQPEFSEIIVNSIIISDSVILWTNDNSLKSSIDMIKSVRMVMSKSFIHGFPLRGAIVEGDLSTFKNSYYTSKDNSINTLVGLGLVKAYKIEGDQNWSGCVVDDSIIKILTAEDKSADLDELVSSGILLKYTVPFKKVEAEKYTVNWITKKKTDILLTHENIRNRFSEHKKNIADEKVEIIINNTIQFVEYVKSLMK